MTKLNDKPRTFCPLIKGFNEIAYSSFLNNYQKVRGKNREQGLILIELLTAVAIFAISIIAIFALFVNATKGILISLDKTRENLLSGEVLEGAFSISKSDPDYLTPGKYEVGINNNNQWVLIPKTGLMGHFLMSNNAKDSSIYKNHGIMHKVSFTEDRKGQPLAAARFNEDDSYIKTELAFSLQIEGPLTISAWVLDTGVQETPRIKTIAGKYNVLTGEGGYMLYKEGNNYYFTISGQGGTVTISAPQSEDLSWEHVAGVYDPGVYDTRKTTLRLYVNGKEKASQETYITSINKVPYIEFFIGNDTSGLNPWYGLISDVRVYNRSLTANELSGLYGSYSAAGKRALIVSDMEKLTGIWSFNEDEGCIAHDNGGNNNHGIIKNCTSTQWVENRHQKEGRAFNFNFENNNYIEIADSSTLQIEDEISISLRLKMPEELPEQDMTILQKRAAGSEDYSFSLLYQGTEKGYGWAISAGAPEQLNQVKLQGTAIPNKWQHLIVTFDSTDKKIYIDNREITDLEESSIDNPGTDSHLFIGRDADGQNNLSGVAIDDLRIYNKILTSAERQAIFLDETNYYLE